MTGLPVGPDKTAKIWRPAHGCKDKTTRAEQKGEDSQKRTGMQGSYNRTARMGQAEQDCQEEGIAIEKQSAGIIKPLNKLIIKI